MRTGEGLAPRLQCGTGGLASGPAIALQGPYVSRHLSSLSSVFYPKTKILRS